MGQAMVDGALLLYDYADGKAKGVPLKRLEVGSLLVYEEECGDGERRKRKVLLKVVGFEYVSQVEEFRLVERALNRVKPASPYPITPMGEPFGLIAKLKVVADITGGRPKPFKSYIEPDSILREPRPGDFPFLFGQPLFLGYLRSGSRVFRDIPVTADPRRVLSKHVIISATTGRGKSNLLKVILWHLMDRPSVGILVMDAHREYYEALSRHPRASRNLVSYSPEPSSGEYTLSVSTKLIEPLHVAGAIDITEPQMRLMWKFREARREDWISAIFEAKEGDVEIQEQAPLSVLKGKLSKLLYIFEGRCKGVFKMGIEDDEYSRGFLTSAQRALEAGKVVLLDTSTLSEEAELLLGNMVAYHMLYERRRRGKEHPPVAFAIEEAPRVLGKDAPSNAYQRIAREGRKFGLGLIAITQLLTVIPEDILANVNTKIYMGMASGKERRAAVDNAMHDLSGEEDEFSMLDVGEALMTSSEIGMPIPIYVPEISELQAGSSPEPPFEKLVDE